MGKGSLGDTWSDSSPHFWPTPTKTNSSYTSEASKQKYKCGMTLEEAVRNWPTPTARLTEPRGAQAKRYTNSRRSNDLDDAVAYHQARGWPTESASHGMTSKLRSRQAIDESGGHKSRLPEAVVLNDPQASGGRLNPAWVEWLMGWPIGWTDLSPLSDQVIANWLKAQHAGEWWVNDPALTETVSRTIQRTPDRNKRLRGIGNGQVPLQAAMAWLLLTSSTKETNS